MQQFTIHALYAVAALVALLGILRPRSKRNNVRNLF
jgi:hypothetical protein